MEFIVGWVEQIVIFILFATVLTMLLPNSNLGKYVKMVVGLLLITIILNPLFQLFRTDLASVIATFQPETYIASGNIENNINFVKKDIEETQRAYILKQMAVQLKNQANEEIQQQFGQDIVAIEIVPENVSGTIETSEDVKEVYITLQKNGEESVIEVVQDVEIGEDNSATVTEKNENEISEQEEIRQYLSGLWGIAENMIHINNRGGEAKE